MEQIVREHGVGRQGAWEVLDNGEGTVQLNLEIDGTITSAPQFGATPRTLVIDNEGLFVGRYVHE